MVKIVSDWKKIVANKAKDKPLKIGIQKGARKKERSKSNEENEKKVLAASHEVGCTMVHN